MSHLVPCSGCQRHVQVTEEHCPFCGVARSLQQRSSPPPAMPTRRLGRAALFAFGATMLSATACSDSTSGTKDAATDTAADTAGTGGSGSGGSGSGGAGSGGKSGSGGAASDGGGGGMDGAVDRGGTGGVAAAYGITPLYGAPAPQDQNDGK